MWRIVQLPLRPTQPYVNCIRRARRSPPQGRAERSASLMTRIPDRDQESALRWLPRMRCAVHLLIYRLERDATLDASALFRLHARPLGRTN